MKKTTVKRLVLTLFLIGVLISCDQFLKLWTHENIMKMSWLHPSYPYGGIAVFKNFLGISFSLNYVENVGAAWGLFSSYPMLLFISRICIVLALFVYLFFYLKEEKRRWPLVMILSGAIGNIFDVINYGHVIDMFHFIFWGYSYPVFNLADAYISIGIVILFFQSFFSIFQKKPDKS